MGMQVDWNAIGSVGTMVAVLIAAWQVRRTRQQAVTDFEDDLTREYRELVRAIPVDVHLGAVPTEDVFEQAFPRIYQYLDLSNEQVFLRMRGRVSRGAWLQWADGMQTTLSLPAFEQAWSHVKSKAPDRFSELRRLEDTRFTEDPRSWVGIWARLKQSWSA